MSEPPSELSTPTPDGSDSELMEHGSPREPSGPDLIKAARKAKLRAALFGESDGAPSFGRYVVLDTVGRGGMGTVLEAFDRSLDRRVAVKVLHRDIATRQTQRLVREAQALAKLSHPNVVQVYEVGEVEGQTFVAMELVRGRTLREWAKQTPRPTWAQCVEVYLQAGAGLAAAHAEGLVHRDFKPGNAIVDDKERVKVLDFGLARQVEEFSSHEQSSRSRLPSAEGHHTADGRNPSPLDARLTMTGAMVGTLAYMSLEQMQGAEVDARSDQFSFCVSLYEAIYGQRPFAGSSASALTVAIEQQQYRPTPKGLVVPAALRQILVRGLSAEAEERWSSMEALRTELSALVAPRRRTWQALGLVGALGLLGAGLAYRAGQAERPEPEQPCTGAWAQLDGIWGDDRRAEVETAILGTEVPHAPSTWSRVEQHLDHYADAWADKHTEVCEATNVRQEQTEEEMSLRMGCLRRIKTELAATVNVLARTDAEVVDKAVDLVTGLPALSPRCDDVERLAELRRRVPPPEDPDAAAQVERLRDDLADVIVEGEVGKSASAFVRMESLVERAEDLHYPPVVAEVVLLRGVLHGNNGRYADAERDLVRAFRLAAEHGHDEVMLDAATKLAHAVSYQLQRHPEGLVWGQTAVSMAHRSDDEVALPKAMNFLASVVHGQGNYAEAERRYVEALTLCERTLSEEHPLLPIILENLGLVFDRQGKYAEAKQLHERVLALRERTVGSDHPTYAATLHNLGRAHLYMGRYDEAERFFRDAVDKRQRVLSPGHPSIASSMNGLGTVLVNLGRYDDAVRQHQQAAELLERALGDEHPELARTVGNLGLAVNRQGRHAEATEHHRKALKIWLSVLGPEHPDTAATEYNLGSSLENQKLYAEARPHFERSREIFEKTLGLEHPMLGYALVGLALAELGLERAGPAREYAERALTLREANEAPAELLAEARFTLARALWFDRAQRSRAYALAEQAREAYAALGEAEKTYLEEVEQWQSEHPEP